MAVILMFFGLGIIGVLSSYLALLPFLYFPSEKEGSSKS